MKVAVLKGGRSLERAVSLSSGARVETQRWPSVTRSSRSMPTSGSSAGSAPRLRCRIHRPARARRRGRHRPVAARAARHPLHRPRHSRQRSLHGQGSGQAPDAGRRDPDARLVRLRRGGLPRARRRRAFSEIESSLGLPLVVKPASQGSALGVRFAATAEEVPAALVAALSYDDRVLIERHVSGKERPSHRRRRGAADRRGHPRAGRCLQLRSALRDRSHPLRLSGRAAGRDRRRGPGCRPADLVGARLPGLRAGRRDARRRRGRSAGARGQFDPGDDRHLPSADGRRGGGNQLRGLRRARAGPGALLSYFATLTFTVFLARLPPLQ